MLPKPHQRLAALFVWLGLLTSLVALFSYLAFFSRFPALRDFPWLNLPMALLGAGVAFFGLWRVFKFQKSLLHKGLSILGTLGTIAASSFFVLYIFVFSSQLPTTEKVPTVGTLAPDFSLPDQHGKTHTLSKLRGKKVILIFYRGFW